MPKRSEPSYETIFSGLAPTATTTERLSALGEIGLTAVQVCVAVHVTDRALRNWKNNSSVPSAQHLERLDDLRTVMSLLIFEKRLPAERAAQWMCSRLIQPPYERPIDILSTDPHIVIAAASAVNKSVE